MRRRPSLLVLLALACLALAACTGNPQPAPSPSRSSPPTPVTVGAPKGTVVSATTADPGVLAKMTVKPAPSGEVADAVHELLAVDVTTQVHALATDGSFASGSQFSIAGQVSPLTTASRTALIRLRGPGYDGRHQAAVDQAGFVAATLTLPKLAPGRWYVAIEDLSQVSPGPDGQETGHALLDLAIYDVR